MSPVSWRAVALLVPNLLGINPGESPAPPHSLLETSAVRNAGEFLLVRWSRYSQNPNRAVPSSFLLLLMLPTPAPAPSHAPRPAPPFLPPVSRSEKYGIVLPLIWTSLQSPSREWRKVFKVLTCSRRVCVCFQLSYEVRSNSKCYIRRFDRTNSEYPCPFVGSLSVCLPSLPPPVGIAIPPSLPWNSPLICFVRT